VAKVTEYGKIPGPFKRQTSGPNKNKLIVWEWSTPELELLSNIDWTFTEKIDGTNIRVIWDGHRPEFRGRTDKAQLPPKLLDALAELFPEELLEQTFGANPAVLYGEGYGAGIQKGGGRYRQDNSFILFDVHIGGWWLQREAVNEIATSLGIFKVPTRFRGTLRDAILTMMRHQTYSDIAEDATLVAEGWVGQPKIPLFTRRGDRIIVKLKGCDLYGLSPLTAAE
jgi:RNA ligase-like protein